MKKQKVTQHQAIFYQLYNAFFRSHTEYTPIWKLIGEVYVKELGLWGYVSYEVSARMSELFSKNPNLFQRTKMEGKSGAKYYAYKIRTDVKKEDIIDPDLKEFHRKVMLGRMGS